MKSYVRDILISAVTWLMASAFFLLIIYFVAYLFSAEWSYRVIFWRFYLVGLSVLMVIQTVAHIFFIPWLEVYKREYRKGRNQAFAAQIADNEIKIRAPRQLLDLFAR
jgi:hypothetical protein